MKIITKIPTWIEGGTFSPFIAPPIMSTKVDMTGYSILDMRYAWLIICLVFPFFCFGQQPGFRKLYNGEITGATFVDILWDGEKLITSGRFVTDTVAGNAVGGLLYMELDTNGNTLMTDIYFNPDDAVFSRIGNSLFQSENGVTYALSQTLQDSLIVLAMYQNSQRLGVKIIPVDRIGRKLLHAADYDGNLLLSGNRVNYQYKTEGVLIKTDPLGHEIWRKYYGESGFDCGIGEPLVEDANTIILSGYKNFTTDDPSVPTWASTWIIKVDSLGNIKSAWESPQNAENGVASRMLRQSNGDWLYTTSKPTSNNVELELLPQPMIVRRDSNLNLLWERPLPTVPSLNCYTIDLQPTSDGNFIVVGFLNDEAWRGRSIIHKFSPSGDSIWTFNDYCNPAYGCYEYLGGVTELPNSGSVFAAGYYIDADAYKTYGLIIKLSKNGCIDSLCTGTNSTYEAAVVLRIKVYPNPASDLLHISNPIGERVELWDMEGRLVHIEQVKGEQVTIRIHDLPTGAYVVRMEEPKLRVSYQIVKH
jgi:Secretion system C-terminal sorting domain